MYIYCMLLQIIMLPAVTFLVWLMTFEMKTICVLCVASVEGSLTYTLRHGKTISKLSHYYQ